ncbi:hypothetical protein DRW07_13635 [Alteromonas sediminis]|uniref:Signal transduction histidine kinase internal region domain-containing protein n=1 Tax=Alteromonas sediminis TaxID=2259342 RepID=A0A3N5Z9E9_9ALTE|nr:histidine kinase [Alteromonas sediminis]RPJ65848.1 hypothetical protein DRW07_13635 [Alteromonas sediminis]
MRLVKYCWLILLLFSQMGLSETIVVEERTMTSHFFYMPNNGENRQSVPSYKERMQKRAFPGLPLQERNLWIFVEFDFPEDKANLQSLFVAALGSYHAWWDGEFIGSNGVPGNSKKTEVAGNIESRLAIPVHLSGKGKHTLLLQFSAHHNQPEQDFGMFWAFIFDQNDQAPSSVGDHFLPILMCGGLLLLSCYCLIHFVLSEKQSSYLVFSLLSLTIVALFMTESWRGLWGYAYHWHIPRLQLVLLLTFVVALLLVVFTLKLFKFRVPEILAWLTLALILQISLLFLFTGYDATSLQIFLVSIGVSMAISIRAIYLTQPYAKSMLAGLILVVSPVLINPHFYMEQYFFVSFSVFVCLMLYILSQSMVNQQRQLLQTQLTASRLELELVKRQVQPHFILNTLTAVEEWIEESPKTAIQFVQALAEEFRNIFTFAKEKRISLAQEVSLCRAHLKVLEYRSKGTYRLMLTTPSESIMIPPGVLLTLLENALTHNRYGNNTVEFDCEIELTEKVVSLQFRSPIIHPSPSNALNTGLGLQYMTARMNESFGSGWQHSAQSTGEYWVCNLHFPLTFED